MGASKKINVVVIGGGNGSAIVLSGLKRYAPELELSAVISMSDSGGSTGVLRKEFNTIPPSDIMRAVVAMSKYDFGVLRQIFYRNRFHDLGKFDKHNLGNLFVTLAARYVGDFVSAIRALEQSLEAVGRAFPVTLEPNDSGVELTDGQIIRGDEAIDRPSYDRNLRIKKMWLEPAPSAYSGALKAIAEADIIILSPGSLYTSVVATLLPEGIKIALAASRARLVYCSGNTFATNGETGPTVLSEIVGELERYLPRPLDLIIYNNHLLNAEQKARYQAKRWALLMLDLEKLADYEVMLADYEKDEGGLSGEKLGEILYPVICR